MENKSGRAMTNKQRVIAILHILDSVYPNAKIVLHYQNPWELLVSVMLSAQCTDVTVNKVTGNLFRKYPSLDAYVNANPDEFMTDIKSTGFFRVKAKHILAAAQKIKGEFHGQVPKTMGELMTLPGVARKTANVVLGNAYGIVVGIAVDTHVLRISQRLRLVGPDGIGGKKNMTFVRASQTVHDYYKDADPVKIERELMITIPQTHWFTLTYRIIDHGRSVCKAQNPKCAECPLRQLCPSSRL